MVGFLTVATFIVIGEDGAVALVVLFTPTLSELLAVSIAKPVPRLLVLPSVAPVFTQRFGSTQAPEAVVQYCKRTERIAVPEGTLNLKLCVVVAAEADEPSVNERAVICDPEAVANGNTDSPRPVMSMYRNNRFRRACAEIRLFCILFFVL
jgi:hypothetical protein